MTSAFLHIDAPLNSPWTMLMKHCSSCFLLWIRNWFIIAHNRLNLRPLCHQMRPVVMHLGINPPAGGFACGLEQRRLGQWKLYACKYCLQLNEAEYCAVASACKEVIAQKRLFEAFGLSFPDQLPVLVDDQSAIALACGPGAHYQRTKHIGITMVSITTSVNCYWMG